MGMISTIGLVLHPRRDCGGVIDTIAKWARERDIEALGLVDEVHRTEGVAAASSDEWGSGRTCWSAWAATARCCARCAWRSPAACRCSA